MALPPVIVEMRAKAGELKSELGSVKGEISKLAKDGTSKGQQLSSGLAKAGKAITAALGGSLLLVGTESIHMADQFEVSHARLVTAIHNAGQSLVPYKAAIDAADQKMEHFGYTNTQTEGALAVLTQATKSPKTALSDLSVAANIAAARHMDLEKASILVGKVAQGNTTVLKKFGIDLGITAGGATKVAAAQKVLAKAGTAYQAVIDKIHAGHLKGAPAYAALKAAQDKVASAQQNLTDAQNAGKRGIDALTSRFKGNAAAAADTFAGKQAALKAQVGDLGTKLGLWLIPKISALVGWIVKAVGWFQKHTGVAKALGIAIGTILVVAVGAYIVSMASAAAATLAATWPILLIIAAVALIALGIYELVTHWSQAWDWIKKTASDAWDHITSAISTGFHAVLDFIKSIPGRILDGLKSLGTLLVGWAKSGFHYLQAHWSGIITNFVAFWVGLPIKIITLIVKFDMMFYTWLAHAFVTLVSKIPAISVWFWSFWIGLVPKILSLIVKFDTAYWKWLAHAFVTLVDKLPGMAVWMFSWFKSLPGKIVRAIGDVAGVMIGVGKAIIAGIVKGIGSAGAGAIGGAIKGAIKGGLSLIPGVGAVTGLIPGFDVGGVVPGPIGKPTLAVVHGGETIYPTHKTPLARPGTASGGGDTEINVYAQTNADPHQIASAIAWKLKTA